jgi:hypothetical protein
MIFLQDILATETFEWFDKLSGKFLMRLAIDLISVFIVVRLIYFKNYRRTDLFLTFFIFNLIIFLITFLLNKVEMSMGAAFGLFAVFSMLRYRTEGISAKDMTYLLLGRPQPTLSNYYWCYGLARKQYFDEKRAYKNHHL